MTFGPIDLIALEFPGNRFKGEILPEMLELVDKGIIRIIDLVVIMKDQGEVIVRELRELDAAHIAMFDPLQADVSQMITRTDIDMIAGQLAENSTAGIMLIENLWAKQTMQAMLDCQRPAGDVRAHPARRRGRSAGRHRRARRGVSVNAIARHRSHAEPMRSQSRPSGGSYDEKKKSNDACRGHDRRSCRDGGRCPPPSTAEVRRARGGRAAGSGSSLSAGCG